MIRLRMNVLRWWFESGVLSKLQWMCGFAITYKAERDGWFYVLVSIEGGRSEEISAIARHYKKYIK